VARLFSGVATAPPRHPLAPPLTLPVTMLAHQCPIQIVNIELAKMETVPYSFPVSRFATCVNTCLSPQHVDCEYRTGEYGNSSIFVSCFPIHYFSLLVSIHAYHRNTSIVNIELANVETVPYSFPVSRFTTSVYLCQYMPITAIRRL
jgi:hypothetical protein